MSVGSPTVFDSMPRLAPLLGVGLELRLERGELGERRIRVRRFLAAVGAALAVPLGARRDACAAGRARGAAGRTAASPPLAVGAWSRLSFALWSALAVGRRSPCRRRRRFRRPTARAARAVPVPVTLRFFAGRAGGMRACVALRDGGGRDGLRRVPGRQTSIISGSAAAQPRLRSVSAWLGRRRRRLSPRRRPLDCAQSTRPAASARQRRRQALRPAQLGVGGRFGCRRQSVCAASTGGRRRHRQRSAASAAWLRTASTSLGLRHRPASAIAGQRSASARSPAARRRSTFASARASRRRRATARRHSRRLQRLRPPLHAIAERAQDRGEIFARRADQRRHGADHGEAAAVERARRLRRGAPSRHASAGRIRSASRSRISTRTARSPHTR